MVGVLRETGGIICSSLNPSTIKIGKLRFNLTAGYRLTSKYKKRTMV